MGIISLLANALPAASPMQRLNKICWPDCIEKNRSYVLLDHNATYFPFRSTLSRDLSGRAGLPKSWKKRRNSGSSSGRWKEGTSVLLGGIMAKRWMHKPKGHTLCASTVESVSQQQCYARTVYRPHVNVNVVVTFPSKAIVILPWKIKTKTICQI